MKQQLAKYVLLIYLTFNTTRAFATNLQFEGDWHEDDVAKIYATWKLMPKAIHDLPMIHLYRAPNLFLTLQSRLGLKNTVILVSENDASNDFQREFVEKLFVILDQKLGFSETDAWRRLSGWPSSTMFEMVAPNWLIGAENQDPRAFAKHAGLNSARSDFTSFAAEYFVPNTKFFGENSVKCRANLKYQYFKNLFHDNHSPMEAVICKSIDRGFLDDIRFLHPITRTDIDFGPINADTVAGFELLYATPGVGEMAEVAGHLLLRIKLRNNPFAQRSEIENPYDIVVSFLADTEVEPPQTKALAKEQICKESNFLGMRTREENFDPFAATIQALKGLSGGFLTTFDRNSLYATVFNYTVLQDRNLLRYELNISHEQKISLLNRLFAAKKSYKSKYYFFNRNCASILVKVIAEGLGRQDIEEFDPLVSPPNSLVALLSRRGLVKPVFPSFYGYRKEAQIAQQLIAEELLSIRSLTMDTQPTNSAFFSKNSSQRVKSWDYLVEKEKNNPNISPHLFRIAQLVQISEKLYLDREDLCQDFTSELTAKTRMYMKDRDSATQVVRLDHRLQKQHLPFEQQVAATGSKHTGLFAFNIGIGQRINGERYYNLGLAIHKQEMGDISAYAMQRTSEVKLGVIDADVASTGEVTKLNMTGLRIQKFRDRLNKAPTIFSPHRTFGIGLGLLDYQKHSRDSELEWGRAELLFSLFSKEMHDQHVYLSFGAAYKTDWIDSKRSDTLSCPLGLHTLWTFDQQRTYQIRLRLEYEPRLAMKNAELFKSEVIFTHQLATNSYSDLLLHLKYISSETQLESYQIGLEINRW